MFDIVGVGENPGLTANDLKPGQIEYRSYQENLKSPKAKKDDWGQRFMDADAALFDAIKWQSKNNLVPHFKWLLKSLSDHHKTLNDILDCVSGLDKQRIQVGITVPFNTKMEKINLLRVALNALKHGETCFCGKAFTEKSMRHTKDCMQAQAALNATDDR